MAEDRPVGRWIHEYGWRSGVRGVGRVDYLVLRSMTQFTAENRRRTYGGGLVVPLLAGVRRNRIELVVGITVRVVDVRSGEVATTATAQGISDRKALRVGALGLFSRGGGGGSRTTPPGREMPSSARPSSAPLPPRRRELSIRAHGSRRRAPAGPIERSKGCAGGQSARGRVVARA